MKQVLNDSNMDDKLVEQITAAVLGQLRIDSPAVRLEVNQTDSDLLITENVITADLLERQVNGAAHIRIGQKSVLTPSARDYLRERRIEWSREELVNENRTTTTRWKAIVVQSTAAITQVLESQNQISETRWEQELLGNVDEAVSAAIGSLCRADVEKIAVFADEAELVACLSNRNERIRAVVIDNVESAKRVQGQMDANLFVIRPAEKSYIELRNILRVIQKRK